MTDDDFLHHFETGAIPLTDWHHREHVKLAYLYCARLGIKAAERKLRDGLRAFLAAHGIADTPTSGYHETMTMAWLQLVHTTIEEYGPRATADEFCDANPQLSEKKALRLFYSADLFTSPRARREFVEPDLTALPKKEWPDDPDILSEQWPV